MQRELTKHTPLLGLEGNLLQVGWARHPLLNCNLEKAAFYPKFLNKLQFIRVKRWDYYAIFTPNRFFSATIADLGYAGNIFVYTLDFKTGDLHEEGLVIPLGKGITLSRQTSGICHFESKDIRMTFDTTPETRKIDVDWPSFHEGRGIHAEISLLQEQDYESMNIVIPIGKKRFYYNHKINCLPANGFLRYGEENITLEPNNSLGQLDWGRGVWEYSSYWNWASASGFQSDGRRVGLNIGCGFGDTSEATENALILDNRVHKLDQVIFDYDPKEYMKPWKFKDNQDRLDLDFVPFRDRVATTKLVVIDSEVHQLFGRYSGKVRADDGEIIHLDGLIGFAEEHHARW
jgi:hypothetical protein